MQVFIHFETSSELFLQKLDTTDYSVTDIGFICGYESLSTFMNAFKEKFGISPGKYRST